MALGSGGGVSLGEVTAINDRTSDTTPTLTGEIWYQETGGGDDKKTTLEQIFNAGVWSTNTATSGTITRLAITPTYNQASGTAANTDLLINRTETAVGSGAQRLADFQVGGTSKVYLDNAGVFVFNDDTGRTLKGGAVAGQDAVIAGLSTAGYFHVAGSNTSLSIGNGTTRHTWISTNAGISAGYNMPRGSGINIVNSTTEAADAGFIRSRQFVLTGQTTDATQTELTAGGTQYTTPANSAVGFTIYVVGRRTDADGESAFYRVEGMIDNNSTTTALVGSVTTTTLAEDTAGWDVTVTADDTNNTPNVLVTGAEASTVDWTANILLTISDAD